MHLAEIVAMLEESKDYKVLRRFVVRDSYAARDLDAPRDVDPPPLSRGLVLDLETTGLDTATVGIVEIGLVPFEFSRDGRVFDVGEPYGSYNDPGIPIPEDVTRLTGITDDLVRGQRMDEARIAELIDGAALLIAHNAGFDRPIAERHFPSAIAKHWACSQLDVPWKATGARSTVLEFLLFKHCGEFAEGHRAIEDAFVTLHLLATARIEDRFALAHLVDAARTPQVRVYAIGSPFSYKDVLKARGYFWSGGEGGKPKAWFRDVDAEDATVRAECEWLAEHALVHSPLRKRITSKERYSDRAG